ncbi:site-specific integrase [Mycoplasmatota bacterium WC30]
MTPKKIKIKDIITKYQEYSKINKADETVRYQQSHVNSLFRFFDNNKILYTNQITEKSLNNLRVFLRTTCIAKTENKRINYLKQVFNHYNIKNKSLSSANKIRETRLKYDVIHETELKRILEYTFDIQEDNPYYLTRKLIILLLLDTGVRQSELLNIEINNIDFNENSIYLSRTKTRLARTVFFTKLTRSLIIKYIAVDPIRQYLLWNYISYQKFNYRNLEWIMKKIKKDLKLKKLNARMFRHTMATALAENGCDIYTIQKLLGHTDISTTEIYLHMSLKKTKEDYRKYNLVDNMEKED